MAENNTPNNFPFPPFGPPPHGGYSGGPPPPFWDFINSMADGGRDGATGAGVDHTTNPEHGFEFGPEGFNAWSGPHGFGGAWGRRGRGGWGFGMGPRGGRRGRGRHGHGSHHHTQSPFDLGNDEDLNDIAVAAAVAEAEMEAARDNEKDGSPATMRDAGDEHPDPPEEAPLAGLSGEEGRRFRGCRGGFRGFGRGRGRGRGPPFGGPPFGGPPFGGHAGGPPFGPPPFGGPPPFDFNAMMENLSHHPHFQRIRDYCQRIRDLGQQGGNAEDQRGDDNSFTPPVDIFDTTNNWTIHIAVPGAKKEDVGVNWDAGRSTLTVSGVVHRPGNEEFLNSMISGERRVGLFERKIKLPPVQEDKEESKDEVDGDHITAKMEDGILVVIVPKVEKEWTEIKKVDIL